MSSHAHRFLALLAKNLPANERLIVVSNDEVTSRPKDYKGDRTNISWWGKPPKLVDGRYVLRRAAVSNHFVCIASMKATPHPETGEMRYWRKESAFGHGLAVMLDDIGSGKGSKGELSLQEVAGKLLPTAIVETSPNNFQVWYVLSEPEPNRQHFKDFITSFVNAALQNGGDKSITDTVRIGRIPAGVNSKRHAEDWSYKYADANGEPWKVSLKFLDETKLYTIDEICKAFQFKVQSSKPRTLASNVDASFNMAMFNAAYEALKHNGGEGNTPLQPGRHKYRINCPWGHEHANGDPTGAYFRGPSDDEVYEHSFAFGCAHETCNFEVQYNKSGKALPFPPGKHHRTWQHFVDAVSIPYIVTQLEKANQK